MPDVKLDESIYNDIALGGLAFLILMFVIPFTEFEDWFVQTFVGATIATFFFSPLMSWITGKEKTIREKTLFVIGGLLYVLLYLYLADFWTFVEVTLKGIAVYAFVSSIVKVLWVELAKHLP